MLKSAEIGDSASQVQDSHTTYAKIFMIFSLYYGMKAHQPATHANADNNREVTSVARLQLHTTTCICDQMVSLRMFHPGIRTSLHNFVWYVLYSIFLNSIKLRKTYNPRNLLGAKWWLTCLNLRVTGLGA